MLFWGGGLEQLHRFRGEMLRFRDTLTNDELPNPGKLGPPHDLVLTKEHHVEASLTRICLLPGRDR